MSKTAHKYEAGYEQASFYVTACRCFWNVWLTHNSWCFDRC